MGNTMGEGVGLAGPGAGDNQQWRSDMTVGTDAVLDSSALLGIERLKI
jgi:hypothetical protein